MSLAEARDGVAVTDGENDATGPAEVQLDDGVGRIAGGTPVFWGRAIAECRRDGRDEIVWRLGDIAERGASAAATVRGVHVRHTDHAPAPAARSQVRLARRLRADGTVDGLSDAKGALIDVTDRGVRATDERARLIPKRDRMRVTVDASVFDAAMRMPVAPLASAGGTDGDFVRGEDGAGIEGALVAMLVADKPTRDVSAPEMRRAVHTLIDGARRPMMLADGLPAAQAARHLVDADVLAPSALALRQTLRAEAALPARRR